MKGERYSVEELLANESLQRWVFGTASFEEKHYWDTYAQVFPDRAEDLEEAVEVLSSLSLSPPETPAEEEIHREWEALLHRAKQEATATGPGKAPLRLVPGSTAFRIAASVLILFIAGVAIWGYTGGDVLSYFKKTYTTDYGERASIQLADGSIVVINAHSSLTAPRWYNKTAPFTVDLKGEAFFEVTDRPSDAEHHFTVRTSQGEIGVLGTAFNLQSRGNTTRVTLNEGSLRVTKAVEQGDSMQETMLVPGQFAEFGDSNPMIHVEEVNPLLHSSWTTSQLLFDNTPFQEVVSLLKYTYGYKVLVEDDSLHDVKISGKIENKQQVLLEGLSSVIDRSIIFEDGVVIIQ